MGTDLCPVAKPPDWLANKPMPKTPGKSQPKTPSKTGAQKAGPSKEATENAPPQKAAMRKSLGEPARKSLGEPARKSLGEPARKSLGEPAVAAKPTRKSAVFHSTPAPVDEDLKRQLRDTQELLEITQADETDAKKELQHWKAQVEVLEETIRQSDERESGMVTLLETLGHNTITLNGVEWTTEDARQIIAEEAEAEAEWDRLIEQVHAGRQRTMDMLAEQEALQVKLA